MSVRKSVGAGLLVAMLGLVSGCQPSDIADSAEPVEISGLPPALGGTSAHDHDHGETGPHGGHLIELGRNHRYHAELVEDGSSQSVTIFILDGSMNEVAIESESITLQLQSDSDSPQSFDLFAKSETGPTSTSCFVSNDPSLFAALSLQQTTGRLRAQIGGVQYIGRIAHQAHGHDHRSY